MVKTILSASHSNSEPGTTVAGTTEFWLFGYASFEKSTTESTREVIWRSPGTLSKLYVRVTANSTSASSSVTIRKNAADTALTVTIGAAAIGEFEETSSSVSVAAGDKLCIETVSGGTGTFTMTMVSCIWDATTNCNVRYVAKGYSLATASTTAYLPIAGDRSGTTGTEANVENTIKTAGTIKNGSVNITSNARTTNTTFTVRKNRADTAMVITAGSGVTGHREDTSNSISYAVDDELDWKLTTLTGTQTLIPNSLAVDYETTTTPGRGVLTRGCVGSSADFLVDSLVTWYATIGGGNREGVTTESQVQMKAREAFTFRNLIVYTNTNNVTSNSVIKFRVNGADSGISVTIGASGTGFFADTTNTVTVAAGDLIDFQFVMGGAAAQSMSVRQLSITTDAPAAVNNVTKSLATQTVAISEASFTRLATKARALSTQTVSLSDSIARTVTPFSVTPLEVKKGSFTKSTGANGSTQQITIGFQPKAIIFWWTNQTSEGYIDNHHKTGIGFCDSSAVDTGSRCVSIISNENSATSVTERYSRGNRCIFWGTAGGATEQESYVSAIDSTSFTLTHSTNQVEATIIHYMALGDTNITDTKADTFTTNMATGSQSITSLSFQPDFVLMITTKQTTNANTGTAALYIGMATGPSNEGATTVLSEDARTTMDTWCWQRTDRCLALLVSGTGAANGEAEFTQFTGSGFDINWLAANDNAGLVHFLAIKGGSPLVGSLLQPTSNGVQTYSTTASKTPKGVMLFSANQAASSTVGSNARISIGGTDATNKGCTFSGDTDNVTPSITALRSLTTKAIGLSTEAGTAASSTTNAEADTDSFNSGNFKLNWTTTDATQREILFFAFSSAITANNIVRALATETISISEAAFTRLAAKTRTRTDTAITISESRARLAAKMRPLSTQTTTLSENVIRIKGKIKSLATETVTVTGGTVARLLAKIRTVSDTSGVSETRQRLSAKSRILPAQSISIAEPLPVQRIKGAIKTISQTTIIGENLARLNSKIRAIALQTITVGAGTAARLGTKIRALSTQTVSLSENIARLVARQVIRALATQTVSIGESIARLKSSQRIISQTTILVDNRARLSTKLRAIALQTVPLSESRARIKGAVKTISQTTIISENIARRLAKIRAIAAQTVALADSVTRQIIGGAVEITRTLSQTVVLSDSVGRRLTVQRILTQTVPKAETLVRVRGVVRTLSQSILLSESRSRIKSALRLISQTTLSSDSITKRMTKIRAITQTILTAENVAAETVGNLVRSLVQTVTVSDSIARRTAKLVILAQTITITEQARRLSTKLRIIPAQTITLSDSVTNELNVIIKHATRIISQTIAITEYAKIEVVKKSQRFRKILDPSIKRLKSNHSAWFLGSRGMHDHYEEFSP